VRLLKLIQRQTLHGCLPEHAQQRTPTLLTAARPHTACNQLRVRSTVNMDG